MKKYPSLSLIALCVSLSGCAAGPRHYAQDESRALNLARAGGHLRFGFERFPRWYPLL